MHVHAGHLIRPAIVAALGSLSFVFVSQVNGQSGPPGSIAGRVTITSERPSAETVAVRQDRDACGSEVSVLKIEGENDGLKNAVVRITDIETTVAPDFGEPVLDQNGCQFTPSVVLVAPGQEFKVLNSDGIMHNVHTSSRANRPVNRSMPKFLKELKVRFREPELVTVRCDVHRWMHGHIVVAEHPFYAVTGDDGSFELPNVPDGTYTLEAWHPELGTKSVQVQVTAGQVSEASLAF